MTENQGIWNQREDPHLPQMERRLGQGLTAPQYAVLTGSVEMTDFLLNRRADVNALSEYDETPLDLAIKQDLYGPTWQNGHEDSWNGPQFRIDYAIDLIDLDPDREEEYSITQSRAEQKGRSELVGQLYDQRARAGCHPRASTYSLCRLDGPQ